MPLFILFYIISWMILTFVGGIFIWQERKEMVCFSRKYILFLLKPWKIILFLIATLSLSYISTFGYDPSWDIPETIIMSILTFYFSPYTVGTVYRFYTGIKRNKKELYISLILIFFIACWFYDIYAMIFLLGEYPPMAFSNIGLSPFFYVFAGILWNLDFSKSDGVVFVYTKPEWISYIGEKKVFSKIFLYTLPIIFFICFIFGYFIRINL